MMTNTTANPTGDESAKAAFVPVAMAKSAVRGLSYGALIVITKYTIDYLFSIPFSTRDVGFALAWATLGASRYLRFVWVWIICMLSLSLSYLSHAYPDWRFAAISASVFVLLLTIAGAGWGGRWTGGRWIVNPRPPGWFQ